MLEKEEVMEILGKQLELLSEYVQKPSLMTQEIHMLSQDIAAISRVILEFQDRRLGGLRRENKFPHQGGNEPNNKQLAP